MEQLIWINIAVAAGSLLLGYLFGSIPSGVIIGKVFFHKDPRNYYSHNSGGTNSGRVFGKKIGGDILCGKKTFLLINALDRADAAQRAELLALLDNGEMAPEEKIRAVTALYDALQIAPLTLAAIERYYAEARRELDALSLPPERWQPLWDYACSLLGRNK